MKRVACIGGPLSGKVVTSADLEAPVVSRFVSEPRRSGGVYGDVGGQYHAYNRANGWSKGPKSVYLHESLL